MNDAAGNGHPARNSLNAALTLQRRGRYDEAISRYRDVLKQDPLSVPARHALALALHQAQRHTEAIGEFDTLIQQVGDDALLFANRAAVLLALGSLTEAEQSCHQALRLQPQNFTALFNLGLALEMQARMAEAMRPLHDALKQRPNAVHVAKVLARVAIASDDADAARRALSVLAAIPEHSNLLVVGDLYLVCSDIESAWRAWHQAAADPEFSTKARLRICRTALPAGRPDIAQTEAEAVLRSEPASKLALLYRALALHEAGRAEEAIIEYRTLLEAYPDFAEARSNYLIALQHAPGTAPVDIFNTSRDWAERHAPAQDRGSIIPARGPGTRHRIIWISPRFARGPVNTFFAATLAAMRKQRDVEHTLVMTGPENDGATAAFKMLADRWIDAAAMADDELLQILREIDADAAVDLAGHAPRNRLLVFARRIAPRQCTWLDNFSTTGLPAMDEFLSDERLTPRGMEEQFTEKIVRLPIGRLCYTPPDLPVAERPLEERARQGLLVSFNRMAKVTSAMLDVWARILLALPGWHLLFRNSAARSPQVRKRIVSTFARSGIDSCRIEFEGFSTYAETLASYRRAAVALDTYPFGGCATTCDALWMGVPVVTMRGNTLVSRQSTALLEQCGLGDWVASNDDEYIDIARRLAVGSQPGVHPPMVLRSMVNQQLCDTDRFAESLLRTIIGNAAT